MFYGYREGEEVDPSDEDLQLIPHLVDKVLIPRLTGVRGGGRREGGEGEGEGREGREKKERMSWTSSSFHTSCSPSSLCAIMSSPVQTFCGVCGTLSPPLRPGGQ